MTKRLLCEHKEDWMCEDCCKCSRCCQCNGCMVHTLSLAAAEAWRRQVHKDQIDIPLPP